VEIIYTAQNVRLVEISGTKRGISVSKIYELETNRKIKKYQTCIGESMTLKG
jgi:hypothetical protein